MTSCISGHYACAYLDFSTYPANTGMNLSWVESLGFTWVTCVVKDENYMMGFLSMYV
jgi:hypothetical protein